MNLKRKLFSEVLKLVLNPENLNTAKYVNFGELDSPNEDGEMYKLSYYIRVKKDEIVFARIYSEEKGTGNFWKLINMLELVTCKKIQVECACERLGDSLKAKAWTDLGYGNWEK